MIENGYATWYSCFDDLSSEEAKERQQLEEKAKAEGKGIWSVENIIEPLPLIEAGDS